MKAKIYICLLTVVALLLCSCNISSVETGDTDSSNATTTDGYIDPGPLDWDDVVAHSVEEFIEKMSLEKEGEMFDEKSIPYENVLNNDNITFSEYALFTLKRSSVFYAATGEYRGDKTLEFTFCSADCENPLHTSRYCDSKFQWEIYYSINPKSYGHLDRYELLPNIEEKIYLSDVNNVKTHTFVLSENCYTRLTIPSSHESVEMILNQWINYSIYVRNLLNDSPVAE